MFHLMRRMYRKVSTIFVYLLVSEDREAVKKCRKAVDLIPAKNKEAISGEQLAELLGWDKKSYLERIAQGRASVGYKRRKAKTTGLALWMKLDFSIH